MSQPELSTAKGQTGKKQGIVPQGAPSKVPMESPEIVLPPGSTTANIDSVAPGGRQRGPVEEVIAKRMRQLGKKLQRYRAYATQDPSTLNADQRAALISLPFLEGAYRELEELTKEKGPVDEQELIQAAKLREARESAIKEAESLMSTRIQEYQSQLLAPLGLFLRLYSLLHPARPSDHHHLTFAHLSLPPSLQDEVQATDVLRVGRMYEELANGGAGGVAVLDQLKNGPKGDDEENRHIHYLLDLLSKSVAEDLQAIPTDELAESVVDTQQSAELPSEIIPASIGASRAMSETSLPNGHGEQVEEQDRGQPGLSFLQPDELEPEAALDELGVEAIDENYEIVPQLAAHQTSGLQPPVEDKALNAQATTGSPVPIHVNAAPAFSATPGNWADLDDDEAEVTKSTSGAAPPVLAPEVEITMTPNPVDAEAVQPTSLSQQAAPISPDGKTELVNEGSKTREKLHHNGHRTGGARPEAPARPKGPSTIVDEDGFVSKVRRQVPLATRGRGGRGGTSGKSRGDGSSRGRGGRSSARPSPNSAPGQSQSQGPRSPRVEASANGHKGTPAVS